MLIEIEVLKKWYCEERKYLEQFPVFEREVNLALVNRKEAVAKKLEEVNYKILQENFGNKWQFKFIFDDSKNNHLAAVLFGRLGSDNYQQTKEELNKAFEIDRKKIPPNEDVKAFTEYMFQFMKVEYIEEMLNENGIDSEKIYIEYRERVNGVGSH